MASSGMLHHVALLTTFISEERIPYIIKVTRIGEPVTTIAVQSISSQLASVAIYG
jgi:hypothetical protein